MSDDEFEEAKKHEFFEKIEAGRLKDGSLVMIKGFPCLVTQVDTAKPGKHGSAKVCIQGKDILTNKQYEIAFGAGDIVDAPIVKRKTYTLINIDDGMLELLDEYGEHNSVVSLPEQDHLKDVKAKMMRLFEEGACETVVTVLMTMGRQQAVDVHKAAEGN